MNPLNTSQQAVANEILVLLNDGKVSRNTAVRRLSDYLEKSIMADSESPLSNERNRLASSLLWQIGSEGEASSPATPTSSIDALAERASSSKARWHHLGFALRIAAAFAAVIVSLATARALFPNQLFNAIIPEDLSYVYFKGPDADSSVLAVDEWEDPFADHWAQTTSNRERAEELLGASIHLPEMLLDTYAIKQYTLWLDQYSNTCHVRYENGLTPRKSIEVEQMIFTSAEGKGVKILSDTPVSTIRLAGKEIYCGHQTWRETGQGHHFLAWADGNLIYNVHIHEDFSLDKINQIALELISSIPERSNS